ncbi:MAG: hypothetical protein WCI39_14105 [Gallionellaceae bacterium]
MPNRYTEDRDTLISFLDELNTVLQYEVPRFINNRMQSAYHGALEDLDQTKVIVSVVEKLKSDKHDNELKFYGLVGPQFHLKISVIEQVKERQQRYSSFPNVLKKLLELSAILLGSLSKIFPSIEALAEIVDLLASSISARKKLFN